MKTTIKNPTTVAYTMLLPAIAIMLVFTFYPVLYGAYLGFTEYTAANFGAGTAPRWIGLENFKTVLNDELFRIGLFNSFKYLAVVPVLQIVSLAVAVLVNRNLLGMTFFRASYYVPVITSISLASVMWDWVYNKDGLLNWALGAVGLLAKDTRFGWLNNPNTALWAIMVVTFWRGFGYYMVLYLAGLQSIPKELEEAALLDGANVWDRFWRLTVPLMRPTILLCGLLSTIAATRVLEEILVFTGAGSNGGGPLNSTYTALMYVYQKSLGLDFNYGKASAAALILALLGLLLGWLNFRLTREDGGEKT